MIKIGDKVWCSPGFCAAWGGDGQGSARRAHRVWMQGAVVYIHPHRRYVLVAFAAGRHGVIRQCFPPMEVWPARQRWMEVTA